MEEIILSISELLWSIFLPLVVVTSIVISVLFFKKVLNKITKKESLKANQIIGPVAISLGAMVGTGAIIGVLGSIASVANGGQYYIEAVVGWALIGAIILLPFTYMETITAKVTNMPPKKYIAKYLSPWVASVYAVLFCLMYILGFGGFQFSGINSTITILSSAFISIQLTQMQRYIYIVIPLLILVSIIVLTKKHKVFISAMSILIGVAVAMYLLLVVYFIAKTNSYLPIFFENVGKGMMNPITSAIGVPLGMIVSFQRIIQTAEPGLGALGMSSLESDSHPRPAATVSVCTSLITIFIAIFITSYIVSYGNSLGLFDFANSDSLSLLNSMFMTIYEVAGIVGVVIISLFTLLSGITTLLGSYYFLSKLFTISENMQIAIYIILLLVAGTLAIFGGNIIFEAVDLFLFFVAGINIIAVSKFVWVKKKQYV